MMMISSANWTMEPVFYKDGKLSICSNSQVHRVSVDEGEFKHLQSERAKGKHVRCITCDHTTIITDGTTISEGGQQVVSITNNRRVAENGATDTLQGRDGIKATAVLHLDDKTVIVGFEDGQIFQNNIFVAKCSAKVTGLCVTSEGSVLVADLTGSVYNIVNCLQKVFQIPVDERENQNLRAYRLASIQSPDNIDIIIASGDNGSLFVVSQTNELVKVGDNPHNMPIIQILLDSVNPYQFITVGYDRVIAHWEVLPGGNYLEMLGCLHTLGSTVSHLQVMQNTLYVPQPHKLLVLNLKNEISFDCQLPCSQLLELKVGPIDGLLLLRYQTRIVLFMTHTRETVLTFKVQSVVDAIFESTSSAASASDKDKDNQLQQQYKYQGLSKETYALIMQQSNFTILALQESNNNQGFNVLQLQQNNKHKIIKSSSQIQEIKRIVSQNVQYSNNTVSLSDDNNNIQINGLFLAITQDVLLVANKSTLQLYCLVSKVIISQYKLSFSIVQSCIIPTTKLLCAVVTEDGHLRLFSMSNPSQLQCICNIKLKFGFKCHQKRITAMTATYSDVIFATDDKCIVSYGIAELITQQQQQQQQKQSKVGSQCKKRLNQTEIASEYPLFGIVRSRVFFQQKLQDTQRVTAMLQSGQFSDKIDLKLLRWRETSEENKVDAIAIIQMELNSCTRVERFEFYQKMVVLQYWLSLIQNKPFQRVVFDQHKDRFVEETTFITKFDNLLDGNIVTDSLHLDVIQMLQQNKVKQAIITYSDQNYLTEAICLSKAFGDDSSLLKQVLTSGQNRFSEAKDRQAQSLKLQAAMKQL